MKAESFYEHLVRPLLFSLSAEGAHNVAIRNLRIASNWPAALLREASIFSVSAIDF